MRRFSTILSIALLLTTFHLNAQVSGINLSSLQNLTGMSTLYNLIPQTIGAGTLSAAGLKDDQIKSVINPGITDPAASGPGSEQAAYFINQLSGIIFDAVLDSIKLESQGSEDSVYVPDIFGHQFFGLKKLGIFTKSENIKAPDSYVLDAGDELTISVWGYSVYNLKAEISKDGYIDIPEAGRVYLKGLTFGAAKNLIIRQVGTFINTRSSNVEIVLNYARNISVNIVGDVVEPGTYVIPAINSVFNAMNAAGGPTKIGSIRKVEVKRNGKTVQTFDLYDFLLKGNLYNDFFLQDGDYIYVPPVEKIVKINGTVRRPWKYELKGNETLADLIAMAGGFTSRSYTKAVQLKRYTHNEVELTDLDLTVLNGGKDFVLNDGDDIFVPQIPADFKNFVEVKGSVRFPGQYELKEGYRISDLISAAGGLTFEAYLDRAYITRKTEDLSLIIQKFNLKDVVMTGGSPEDVLLQRGDKIEVFSKQDFLEQFKVSIEGAVLRNVKREYAEGMTLNDLIFYAGGLKKEAANNVIEISRVATKMENGEEVLTRVVVQTVTVGPDLEIDDASKAFLLSPMDQVYVRRNAEFNEQQTITIKGEVAFPGVYPILQKDEKILDLIERAGGLTPYAFLQSAKLYRQDKTIGMVVIDLEQAYRSPDSRPNYILKPGDILEIPTVNQLVSVHGAIGHPELDSLQTISSFYVPGKRAKFYVKKFAGGFDNNARKVSTKVVNPDGSAGYTKKVLFFNRYPAVKEGASVSVDYKSAKVKRQKDKLEAPKEPVNWNLLIPSMIIGGTSVISSTILILILNKN